MNKKPPDKYKCIKTQLKNILIDPERQSLLLNDAVARANRIVIKAYQLLRLWLLSRYEDNNLEVVTTKVITTCFKVIMDNSYTCNDPLYVELNSLFDLGKENGKQLTQVLSQYSATEMLTAFENNIKMHFMDYLNRYVKSYWLIQNKEAIDNGSLLKRDLYKELKPVKNDLMNGTNSCEGSKYEDWVNEIRSKALPKIETVEVNYYYDVHKNPQRYFKGSPS